MEKHVNELIELVKTGVPKVAEQAIQIRYVNSLIIGLLASFTVLLFLILIYWVIKEARSDLGCYRDASGYWVTAFLLSIVTLILLAAAVVNFVQMYYIVTFPDYYMALETAKLGKHLLGR